MKINNNSLGRRMSVVFLLTASANAVFADNKLFIDPVTLTGDEIATVSVMLDNDSTIRGIQGKIVLSEGLEFAGNFTATDRLASLMIKQGNPATGIFLASGMQGQTVAGDNGAIFTVPIKATKDAAGKDLTITLTEQTLVTANKTELPTENSTIQVEYSAGTIEWSTEETSINVTPGSTFKVPVVLTNSADVRGVQMNVNMPEGITFSKYIPNEERWTSTNIANMSGKNIFMVSTLNNDPAFTGSEGVAFELEFNVAEGYEAETAELTFTNIITSNGYNQSIYCPDMTVTLVNSTDAKLLEEANAKIAELREALAAALEEVAEQAPDVKEEFTGDSIATEIDNLEKAVKDAAEAGTLADQFDAIMEPTTGIQEAIDALVPAAVEAERQFKNNAAYEAANDELTKLQDALDAANKTIAEEYPLADVTATSDSIQGAINDIKDAIEAAKEAVATEGNFDYTVEAEPVNEAIEAMLEDAKAQQDAAAGDAERLAANKEAYDKEIEAIDAAAAAVDSIADALIAENPNAEAAIKAAADALKQELDDAKETAAAELDRANKATGEEGTYNDTFDAPAFNTKAEEELKAAAEASADEIQKAKNEEAYNEEVAAIEAAKDAVKELADKLAEENPDAADAITAAADSLYNELDAAKAAAEEALNKANEASPVEKYEPTFNSEEFTAGAEEALNNAVKNAGNDEAVKEANQAAYDKELADIEAAAAAVDSIAAELAKEYPNADLAATVEDLKKQLEDAKEAAANGLAAANEATPVKPYTPAFDAAKFEAEAEKALNAAAGDEAQRITDNKAAYDKEIAALDAAANSVDSIAAALTEKYPEGDLEGLQNAVDALKAQLNDLKAAAADNLAAANADKDGRFENTFDGPAFVEKAEKELTDIASQNPDADRLAANQAAYEKDIEAINAAGKAVDSIAAALTEKYPDADLDGIVSKLKQELTAAKTAASEALTAANEEKGATYEPTFNGEEFVAAADEELTNAAAAGNNGAAYSKVLAEIADLQKKLDAAKDSVAANCKAADVAAQTAAAQAAIDAANAGAKEAFDALQPGQNFEYTVDADNIDALIDAMTAEARRQQNNYELYQETKATVESLNGMIDEKVAELKEQNPDVDLTAAADALKAKVADELKAVNAAYAAVADEGDFKYDFNMGELENEINDALTAEAARQVANNEAYNAAKDVIDALQAKYDAAMDTIAAQYGAADVKEQSDLIAGTLKDLNDALAEEREKTLASGTFVLPIDAEPITEAIEAMLADAKAQQEAAAEDADRLEANNKAYKAALDSLADLQAKFEAAKATVANDCPNADVAEQEAIIASSLEDLQKAIDEERQNTLKAGNFVFAMPTDDFEEGINAFVAEAQRQQGNYNDYQADLAELNQLKDKLADAVAAAKEANPDVDLTAAEKAVTDAINAKAADAAAAYEAVAKEGEYNYNLDPKAIEEAINNLGADADRQAANQAAYEKDLADLAALEAQFKAAQDSIAAEYPVANVEEQAATIAKTLKDMADAIAEQREKTLTSGFYAPVVESEPVEEAIEAMLADAKDQNENANAEDKRKAENQKRYNDALAALADLTKQFEDAKALVAENDPNADVLLQENAIAETIADIADAIEEAYAGVKNEGLFEYSVPVDDAIEAIDALVAEAGRQQANYNAYTKDADAIGALNDKIDAKVAELTAKYPGVDLTATADSLHKVVADELATAKAAYDAVAKEGTYKFDYNMPELEYGIDKALTDDAANQAASNAAYSDAIKALNDLQTQLDVAKTHANTIYPNSDVTAPVANAQGLIDQAKADAKKALDASATTGAFDYSVPTEEIKTAIADILTEAKRQNDNTNAYDAATAKIADLQAKLDAAKAAAGTADVADEVKAAQDAIDAATKAAEEAKAACAEEGAFGYTVPAAEIEGLINAIAPEAARQAANQAAFDAANAQIADLQAKLDAAKEAAAKDYPESDVKAVVDAAQAAIDAATADAAAAKAACADEGTFGYNVPASQIENAINDIVPEAARQAENAKAYDAAKAEIDELAKALDEAIKATSEKYPEVMNAEKVQEAIQKAQDAIANARQDADNAYDAVKDGGNFDYTVDKDAINDLINYIDQIAGETGIMDILVEELGGEVRFFNINGVEVKNPAPGQMVIAVGANGQTKKIIVK